MPVLASFLCGLVFGCGLTISGMAQPTKVLGFLDFFGIPSGAWDPSLAVVMAAGLAVASGGYALLGGRAPLFEKQSLWPYRPALAIRRNFIWYRLGTRRTLSRPRDCEPVDTLATVDCFRDSDGNRDARP
jgi:hypothetical protein